MSDLIVFIILMTLGYGFGRMAEKNHYASIIKREKRYQKIYVIATKYPPATTPIPDTTIVMGSVVISVDYFKRFLASLRNLFGGKVTSYESLLDRARREAILRMKEQASSLGSSMVCNIKIETSSIHKGKRNAVGSVEVLAYGTAMVTPATGD